MIAACDANPGWDVSPACVDAIDQCYPLGPAVLSPIDVINLCSAEYDSGCMSHNYPGCGATFCDCMAGAFPFDWTNCWHLTLAACKHGPNSDCAAVLSMCYPGATEAEYDVCWEEVYTGVGYECDCPMCGIHEQCDAALAACLAG